MSLVLDSGALLALERGDRAMWRRFKASLIAGEPARTHGGVVGQVWRGRGPRHALLAKALASIEVLPIDDALGRAAGRLLAATSGEDVIDAAIALLAEDSDHIFTSDAQEIAGLIAALGRHVEIVPA